jgi:hypothetical protein
LPELGQGLKGYGFKGAGVPKGSKEDIIPMSSLRDTFPVLYRIINEKFTAGIFGVSA